MDRSRVQTVQNILMFTSTKWDRRIFYRKSWWKVYDTIKAHLKENFHELCEISLEKNDLQFDEILSNLSSLKLDDSSNDVIVKLNCEIEKAVQLIIVNGVEASDIVEKITTDLNSSLKKYGLIENKWKTYGSYGTGLSCIDSDVDLYFESIKRTNKAVNIPKRIFTSLKKTTGLFSNVCYIKSARIPIIKLTHVSTGKKCDISFSEIGVKTSALTKFYVQLNPSVKILTLYLKLLLKKYILYGTNKMTSHVIFWLVVFFFQQKKLLPPVKDVRKKYADCKEADLFENWNCSVNNNISRSYCDYSNCLATLLLDFVKYYKDFKFLNNVISPYTGSVIPIEKFENWCIPSEVLPVNFQRTNTDGKNTFYRHVINLQEPSILCSNLAKNVLFKIVNFFKIFCHEFLLSFENYYSSRSCIDFLEDVLPKKLPRNNEPPRDLMQVTSIKFDLSSLNEANSENLTAPLCRAIHRMMAATLHFELKRVVTENVFQIEHNKEQYGPIIYMNYSSTMNTWNTSSTRKLLLFPNRPGNLNEGFGRNVHVYVVGVINTHEREARILIQTDIYLLRFFHKYAPLVLKEAIIP